MLDRGQPLPLWGLWWNAMLLLRPAFSRLRADSSDCGQGFQLIADSHSNPLRTAFQSIADSIPMIADSSLIDSFKGSFGSV
jgi:hypothetical protein